MGLAACKRPTEAAVDAEVRRPVLDADPVIGLVDLEELRVSHVQARVIEIAYGKSKAEVAAQAVVWAASDLLVVREAKVLEQRPKEGESVAAAADRFLAAVWNVERGCQLDEKALRFTRLENLAQYKHPPSWTLWDAQIVCCGDGESCPEAELQRCRQEVELVALKLVQAAKTELALLPPIGPAGEASEVALAESPIKRDHVPAFERAVAQVADVERRLQLRRYTCFAAAPGFPERAFRRCEPAIENAIASKRLGDVVGPVASEWGLDVVLLVAREPLREGGLDDAAVRKAVEKQACEQVVQQERAAYRQRLLKGARFEWRKEALQKAFGPDVVKALPQDWRDQPRPNLPFQ